MHSVNGALNAWLAGTMMHCNRSILLLLSLISMSRAVHTFYKKLILQETCTGTAKYTVLGF